MADGPAALAKIDRLFAAARIAHEIISDCAAGWSWRAAPDEHRGRRVHVLQARLHLLDHPAVLVADLGPGVHGGHAPSVDSREASRRGPARPVVRCPARRRPFPASSRRFHPGPCALRAPSSHAASDAFRRALCIGRPPPFPRATHTIPVPSPPSFSPASGPPATCRSVPRSLTTRTHRRWRWVVSDNEQREARGTERPEGRACCGFRPRNRPRCTARDLSPDAGRMRGPLPCRSRSDRRESGRDPARRSAGRSPLPGMEGGSGGIAAAVPHVQERQERRSRTGGGLVFLRWRRELPVSETLALRAHCDRWRSGLQLVAPEGRMGAVRW